jgi:hypothetical protein
MLSSRDLIAELECNHRLNLEWSAITGLIEKPKEENDPGLQLIIDNGRAHEDKTWPFVILDFKVKSRIILIYEINDLPSEPTNSIRDNLLLLS